MKDIMSIMSIMFKNNLTYFEGYNTGNGLVILFSELHDGKGQSCEIDSINKKITIFIRELGYLIIINFLEENEIPKILTDEFSKGEKKKK